MEKSVATFFLLFNILNTVFAVNYCDLCRNHIACNNNGNFASICPADAVILPLMTDDIEVALNVHNNKRNILAGGFAMGFASATKMMKLKWDKELEDFAKLNVKQCQMKHDGCRATEQYRYAGQNLYSFSTTGNFQDAQTELTKAINAWFNEIIYATQNNTNLCCDMNNFSKIGHFLQIVQDRAVAIGCAIARYTSSGWKNTLVACNYSFGNLIGSPAYVSGPTASACGNGRDSTYINLCNEFSND